MRDRIILLILIMASVFSPGASYASLDDKFVTIKNGHLSRDGVRLRQWGVNLQAGLFKNYNEIDQLVERLNKLGFNAVRIWPTSDTFYQVTSEGVQFLTSKKGDSSALDRFDYLIFKLKESGFTIQMTMLHYVGLPTLRGLRNQEISKIIGEAATDKELIQLSTYAPYISRDYREFLKSHISRVLGRRNPYTGFLYSDESSVSAWELANEASFVNCSLADDCFRKLPNSAIEILEKLWKQSRFNNKKYGLPSISDRRSNSTSIQLFRKFIIDLFVSVSEELKATAINVGGYNSGISKQPFIYSTWAGGDSAASHYSYAAGDVASIGYYHTPLDKNKTNTMYPWRPISMGGNRRALVENIKIKDKPLVVYESSFIRPYPYRAEWGPVMAAIAIQQDWDSVFLYSYGQPEHIYTVVGEEVRYGTKPLAEPYKEGAGVKGTYSFGFNHGSDPVVMASWMVGGQLFLKAEDNNEYEQEEWWIDIESIWSTRTGYPKDFIINNSRLIKNRVAIKFVESSIGRCVPCVTNSNKQLLNGKFSQVTFEDDALKIKNRGGFSIVGSLEGDLFSDYFTSAVTKNKYFGLFAVLDLEDNHAVCKKIFWVGDIRNGGWSLNHAAADDFKYLDMFKAVEYQGTGDLIHDGGEILLKFHNVKSFRLLDFNFYEIGEHSLSDFYVDGKTGSFFIIDVLCGG